MSPGTLANLPVSRKQPPTEAVIGSRNTDRIVPVAKFGAPHGIAGMVRVHLAQASGQVLESCNKWHIGPGEEGPWQEAKMLSVRHHKDWLLVTLDGVADRDQAQQLRGQTVGIERGSFPRLPEGEYYWCDLTGLQVLGEDNALLGEVAQLRSVASNDILEVKAKDDRGTLLIPFNGQYVVSIDLDKGVINTLWREDY